MRISDWSSDVCSSDLFKLLHGGVAMISLALASMLVLAQADAGLPQARRAYGDCLHRAVRSHLDSKTSPAAFDTGLATACAATEAAYRNAIMASEKAAGARARKSVVSGKRVAGRVDVGGRRIIQKKKKR